MERVLPMYMSCHFPSLSLSIPLLHFFFFLSFKFKVQSAVYTPQKYTRREGERESYNTATFASAIYFFFRHFVWLLLFFFFLRETARRERKS